MDLEEEIKKVNEELYSIIFKMKSMQKECVENPQLSDNLEKEYKEIKNKLKELKWKQKQGGNIR